MDGSLIKTSNLKEWLALNGYSQDNLNSVGKYGNSAIMKASREANLSIVDELISLNVDLNVKNIDGNSALWNACFGDSYACFEALVSAGINIDSQNVNNVTSLMYCASAGKDILLSFL